MCGVCFQMQKDTGLWYSVEYSSFSVGPETDKYRLSVSGFSGDIGDALAAPAHPGRIANGMKFSTPDDDNDNSSGNCAYSVGWWFNECSRSVLNRKVDKGAWNPDTDVTVKDVQFDRMLVKLD